MRMTVPGIGVAFVVILACGSGEAPAAPMTRTFQPQAKSPSYCELARNLRRRAIEFYANGKLDRTLRTVREANQLCRQEAVSSRHLEEQTLSDLGVDGTGVSGELAEGERWLREGVSKKAQGDSIASQKLLDRAQAALEQAVSGKTVLEPKNGMWDVTAMSWSADATKLAVATGQDIHILQTDDYQESLLFHSNAAKRVTSLEFSRDSRVLASGSFDNYVELWDLGLATKIGTLDSAGTNRSELQALRTLAFSPDGSVLAGLKWEDPNPILWSVESRTHLRDLVRTDGHGLFGYHRLSARDPGLWPAMLAFSPDGCSLLGLAASEDIASWNLRSKKDYVSRFYKNTVPLSTNDSFYSVAYHPNGRIAAVAAQSGKVLLWDLARDKVIRSVQVNKWNPLVGFSRDGKRLLSVSMYGDIQVFASDSLSPLGSFETKLGSLEAAALHPDARSAAIAREGSLLVQEVDSGKLIKVSRPAQTALPISAIAVNSSVRQIAMGTTHGAVVLLSVEDGTFTLLRGHADEIRTLVFSPDGRWLASASRDKTARIWEVSTRKGQRVLEHPEPLNAVAFSPDGRVVATGGDDRAVRLWDMASGKNLATLASGGCVILTVAFSPDGSVLAANSEDQWAVLWDAKTYAKLLDIPCKSCGCTSENSSWTNTLGFTTDSKVIASAPSGSDVGLWHVKTGQMQTDLTATGPAYLSVRSVAVSPTDAVVVAASRGQIHRWRLPQGIETPIEIKPKKVDVLDSVIYGEDTVRTPEPTGTELTPLTFATFAALDEVDSVVFSADGRFLFGAGRRGSMAVWAIPSGVLQFTLRWVDESSAYVISPNGLVEWLGSKKSEEMHCRLGARIYAAELCEERYITSSLIATVLRGHSNTVDPNQVPGPVKR